MPGLLDDKRGGNNEVQSDFEEAQAPIRYIHVQACGPGGVADADGGFA